MTDKDDVRRPRAFALDDPSVVAVPPEAEPDASMIPGAPPPVDPIAMPSKADLAHGIRWGQILLSAMLGLASLAFGVWFARFTSVALARDDWVGWVAWALLAVMAMAGAALLLREAIGWLRLARLGRLRREIDAALLDKNAGEERRAVDRLAGFYANRPELRWGQARLKDHLKDVRDAGELLRLADRELVAPLDLEARKLILRSAKRVSMVTAISPMAWIAMAYVLVENLRMLRGLAGTYGGRPGVVGGLKLGRMVITHIIASGGIAMTEDLVGQFLGQDLLRRVSRRLGEGAFNGSLTARVGVAAIDVIRPLPFLDAKPIRLRDIVAEILRRKKEPPHQGDVP